MSAKFSRYTVCVIALGRNHELFVAFFNHIVVFEVLYHCSTIKGRPHSATHSRTRYLCIYMVRVSPTPLMEPSLI